VAGLGVFVWSGSAGLVAVIVMAMIISMVAAALSGAAIPMLLTALKRDPAVASSIILTTVTDVVGFFSFLGLATVLAEWIGRAFGLSRTGAAESPPRAAGHLPP
jgi:magnesium transporter